MKREDEIREMAKTYTQVVYDDLDDFSDITDAYIDGAKWADKTMIEKACNWLLKGGYFVNNTETINDFKKAMEL